MAGRMAGKLGAALAAGGWLLLAGAALAQVAPFGEMDLDHDGYLTKREFMGGQVAAQEHVFGMADKNHDGRMSYPEWEMSRRMIEMSVNPGMPFPTPDAYSDPYGGDPMKWGTPEAGSNMSPQPGGGGQYREMGPGMGSRGPGMGQGMGTGGSSGRGGRGY